MADAKQEPEIRTALIVVDMQEDFLTPNGTLPVPTGRSLIPSINALLAQPFTLKLATKDWHPADHISFASSHAGATPFSSTTTLHNPLNPSEKLTTRLWPTHCVQNTPGAELADGLAKERFHGVVNKGERKEVEMYSAFQDAFGQRSGLGDWLKRDKIERVLVVGIAGEYCVLETARDAVRGGWKTGLLEDVVGCVDGSRWGEVKGELERAGVEILKGEEMGKWLGWE